ncbi:NupC/NupG family nucleoside CNT transporter [Desulfobotulus mexicanus]|uniref:Nucleoside:proton symporter n=1 Tax=Desulfobotulus mexicanus TaxID=2586642 RepID=A0A5Q4VET0_9BACT|nr:nucleoside transporter C-terminal domain-containing protein [Desulfobotulus mexicanus]TYT74670.1 nucleoside:proton symporter [Desulfobotulus mexicanus]
MFLSILQSGFGLLAFMFIAWLLSENRKAVSPRLILSGLGLQFLLALILLKVPAFADFFLFLNKAVEALEAGTRAGTTFVFGYLGGGPLPFEEPWSGAAYIFAFRALPVIVVTGALSTLLYHWKIIPVLVRGFSALLQRVMGIGGALGVGCAANIFAGMVESPLFIRPYVKSMTRSELFTLMTCGMATIAGTVLVLYAGIIGQVIPGALGHILAASLISAPASILIAGIMIPESSPPTLGKISPPVESRSSMDAVVKGTTFGLQMYIQIVALLVVLVALVSMVNQALGLLPDMAGEALTLQSILGQIMRPLVWLAGIPWHESHVAGSLMGTKVILNELLAYLDMAALPEGSLSSRSSLIMTYALCGFANIGSLGILIGGLSSIAPERLDEIVTLAPRSILAGVLTTLMTGAMVGIFF